MGSDKLSGQRELLRRFFVRYVILPHRARRDVRKRAMEALAVREVRSRTTIAEAGAGLLMDLCTEAMLTRESLQRSRIVSLCFIWWLGLLWLRENWEWHNLMGWCMYGPQPSTLGPHTCAAELILFEEEQRARNVIIQRELNVALGPDVGLLSRGGASVVFNEEPRRRADLSAEEGDVWRRLWSMYRMSNRIAMVQAFEFDEFLVRREFEKNVDDYFAKKRVQLLAVR